MGFPSLFIGDYLLFIHVYKNGDNYDEGKIIAVTRREFKHWVVFLDGLTEKLETATAVHRLYTLKGIRVDHKWTSLVRILDSKPTYLNSGDSMDIYLRKEGYGSYTGLPYPFDGVIVKSPSALHMSGLSKKVITPSKRSYLTYAIREHSSGRL
uniref:Doublecortin domain-containing protein n=1 Tax=Heterorhabditis bacteriophora TaxID=37862 RepID=A0A1I7WRP9_HETBA